MSAARPKLEDKMEAAIAALLVERTHAEAAAKAGIGVATLSRWLREPEFKSAYKAARRAIVDSAVGRIQAVAMKAVDTLEKNLDCLRPGDANRAAIAILEFSLKAVELGDLAERVDELEALLRNPSDGEEPAAPETDEVAGGRQSGGGEPGEAGPDPEV
jgi:hypothetical protein